MNRSYNIHNGSYCGNAYNNSKRHSHHGSRNNRCNCCYCSRHSRYCRVRKCGDGTQ